VIQRILIRHGFTREMADLLLEEMKGALAYFAEHPVSRSVAELETAGHDHSGR
jgi:glutamate decarboxylase